MDSSMHDDAKLLKELNLSTGALISMMKAADYLEHTTRLRSAARSLAQWLAETSHDLERIREELGITCDLTQEEAANATSEKPFLFPETTAPPASTSCPLAEALGDDLFDLVLAQDQLRALQLGRLKGVSRAWWTAARRACAPNTSNLTGLLAYCADDQLVLDRIATHPEELYEEDYSQEQFPLPLHRAIGSGASVKVVRELLKAHPKAISYKHPDAGFGFHPPIVLAAMYGSLPDMVDMLAAATDFNRLSTLELALARQHGER